MVTFVICFCADPAFSQAPALSIGNYQVISRIRVGRLEDEFTIKANLTNTGAAISGITASATANSAATSLSKATLNFGPVALGATVLSSDTFKIIQDRTKSFDPTVLQWAFSSQPSAPTIVQPPSPTKLLTIPVTGTARPNASVEISGGTAIVTATAAADGTYTANIPLQLNRVNKLFVTAITGASERSAPAAADVIQDGVAPSLFIDFPADGAELTNDTITVAGRVGDMLSGFAGLTVTVNGQSANVIVGIGNNGTFERAGVPLVLGPTPPTSNTITVVASDVNGNSTTKTITVKRAALTGMRMVVASGDMQVGGVHARLAAPIVVQVLNADGTPFAGKLVTFNVTRSDGRLKPTTSLTVVGTMLFQTHTNATGMATAFWTLGGDAGCANNRVTVTSKDIAGTITFSASAMPGPLSQINIGSGNNQRVETNTPAPETLRAWVSDSCNGIEGVPVTYSVVQGGGKVNGRDSVTVYSTRTGHSEVSYLAGPDTGNQIVEATYLGNNGSPATFVIFGIQRDPNFQTSFTGLILDNTSQPIGGAFCSLTIGSTTLTTTSDIQGRFAFANAPAGHADFFVSGSTANSLGGTFIPPNSFPFLSFTPTLIPNAENTLSMPVLLPRLNTANNVTYNGITDLVLTCQGMEGLKMTIKANSMRKANGTLVTPTNTAVVSLNQVHHDNVPMPIPDGAAPPFTWTLQPARATFNPPIQIEYPNMSGLPAGTIAYFLSFNHDTERFEIISSGHVTDDGSTIVTDAGDGLDIAGWGCNCPPYSVSGKVRNKCKLAVVCFSGGTTLLGSSGSAGGALRALCNGLKQIDTNRVFIRNVGADSDLADQITPAQRWLRDFYDQDGERAKILLVGHSLGGDTIRLSGAITADSRVAIDPISRDLALARGGNQRTYYQRRITGFSAPSNLDGNYLATDLTETEIESCRPPVSLLHTSCLRGYFMDGIGDVLGGDHSSVVPLAAARITMIARNLLPANALPLSDDQLAPVPQLLDESFTVRVGGQSWTLDEDGTIQLANVSAPDQFGPSGPGSPPDFIGDDFMRAIAVSTKGGSNRYAFSEFFQIKQSGTTFLSDLTFTSTPPPFPERLRMTVDSPTFTFVGQITRLHVFGRLADGTEQDVTLRTKWTVYRTSNPAVTTVGPDGLVTARGSGVAFLTAVNEGATAVARVIVALGDPLTRVEGFARDGNGQPVVGAVVSIVGQSLTGTTDANGFFSIPGVLTTLGDISVRVTAGNLAAVTPRIPPLPGGITDAGISVLLPGQNEGREFIVVFERNLEENAQRNLTLFVSSDQSTAGTVEIQGIGFTSDFSVVPGIVTQVEIPLSALVLNSNAVINRGIHITADRPVNVYGLNRELASTDAFTALPVETFGKRYRAMTYTHASGFGDVLASQFAVVAEEANTTVTIVPTVATTGRPAGQPFQITLNRFDVYQLRTSTAGTDLTGSLITSDKPIGVFSGNRCAFVPVNNRFCDHLCEQLPPTDTWGRIILTTPLATRLNGDTFRILADQADTDVTITGVTPATTRLQPGQFREVILTARSVISATKPVLVAQYCNSSNFDGVTSDPFMMLVPPAEQFLRNYTFATPGSGFGVNYVNVVAPSTDANGGMVFLDSQAIPASAFAAIGASGFSAAVRAISIGSHTVSGPNPVGIYVYGFASFDSYGYPGGLALTRTGTPVSPLLAALIEQMAIPSGSPPPEGDISAADALLGGTDGSGMPKSIQLVGGGPNGAAIQIQFATAIGSTYQVQCCNDLKIGDWQPLGGSFPGTGKAMTIVDPASSTRLQCFYRVVLVDTP